LSARFAGTILVLARANPMVLANSPIRDFRSAKTCSTAKRILDRVALPLAICSGIASPRGFPR